eukprot:gene11419-12765_t
MPSFNKYVGAVLHAYKTPLFVLLLLLLFAWVSWHAYRSILLPHMQEGLTDPANTGMRVREATLMLFTSKTCPHCQKAAPLWLQFKEQYQKQPLPNVSLSFTDLDVTPPASAAATAQMEQYKIKGVPTVIMISNGTTYTYDAQITPEHLLDFVKKSLA